MVKLRILVQTAILLMLAGCIDITEHELACRADLYLISAGDFSTITTYSDLSGAKCLLIYPGNFFVVSEEGTISRYNSETLELVDVYKVASPSPAGFTEIVFSTVKNTAYLVGSQGTILEISLPTCTVVDEFSVCVSPVKLALGPGSEFLFVADGPTNRIHQVAIENNRAYDFADIYHTINCMEPGQNPDSMLVGTSDGINLVEVLSPTVIRSVRLIDTVDPRPFYDFACIPDDTVFVGVGDYYGEFIGIVDVFVGIEYPPSDPFFGKVDTEGDNHILAMGTDWQHVYLLSYMGDGTSRLISYSYLYYTIDNIIQIPGQPLDLKVSGSGVIYVLMSE